MSELQHVNDFDIGKDKDLFFVPTGTRRQALSMNWEETITETSTDNLVGRIGEYVIKRSKDQFDTEYEARLNETYIKKQIALYQRLMPDITVSTQTGIAESDGYWHVFQFQPIIPGLTTRQLEQEGIMSDQIQESYQALYRRLFSIYRAEHDVNRYIDEGNRFQLTKVQPIGTHAFENRFFPKRVLASDNLMVNPETGQFYVFDFGRYKAWKPEMEDSYTKIVEKAQTKLSKYSPDK